MALSKCSLWGVKLVQCVQWWSSTAVMWSLRCLSRGREADALSSYGALGKSPVVQQSNRTQLRGWPRWIIYSRCVPLHYEGRQGPLLEHILIVLQLAHSQMLSCSSPSELVVVDGGSNSNMGQPMRGMLPLPKQRHRPAPSTKDPQSLCLLQCIKVHNAQKCCEPLYPLSQPCWYVLWPHKLVPTEVLSYDATHAVINLLELLVGLHEQCGGHRTLTEVSSDPTNTKGHCIHSVRACVFSQRALLQHSDKLT